MFSSCRENWIKGKKDDKNIAHQIKGIEWRKICNSCERGYNDYSLVI